MWVTPADHLVSTQLVASTRLGRDVLKLVFIWIKRNGTLCLDSMHSSECQTQ